MVDHEADTDNDNASVLELPCTQPCLKQQNQSTSVSPRPYSKQANTKVLDSSQKRKRDVNEEVSTIQENADRCSRLIVQPSPGPLT